MLHLIRRTVAQLAPRTGTETEADQLVRDWDRLKAEATTPSQRAEIDAVFSRNAA